MRRALLTLGLLAAPRAAFACPVCFGQTDSPLASATNMGIIALLVIVCAVLSGFAAFIVHLNRRARLFEASGATTAATSVAGAATSTPQEGIA
jgi:hypothetical protein